MSRMRSPGARTERRFSSVSKPEPLAARKPEGELDDELLRLLRLLERLRRLLVRLRVRRLPLRDE